MDQVRCLLYVNNQSEAKWIQARLRLQHKMWPLSWLAMLRAGRTQRPPTDEKVQHGLQALGTWTEQQLDSALVGVVALVLQGRVQEYKPLFNKLSVRQRRQMEAVLGEDMRAALESQGPAHNELRASTWFVVHTKSPAAPVERAMHNLRAFRETQRWTTDAATHQRKCDAFENKAQRQEAIIQTKQRLSVLHQAPSRNNAAIKREKAIMKRLKAEDKLMICRVRKYRLIPTSEQQHKLRCIMGTCRWTYNQAVAHFRATGVSKATTLINHYVTRNTTTIREYPDDMGPPPDWSFETPWSYRANTMRQFEANVRSAFSNLTNKNINRFKMRFKSKKRNPLTTFAVNGRDAKVEYKDLTSRPQLSIKGLKHIRIQCKPGVVVTNEVKVTFSNGYWYVIIPQFARPREPDLQGRCIALDPGVRTFLTGVDLQGNTVEIGRTSGTTERPARDHPKALKARASRAQHDMAMIRNKHGHRTGKQWTALTTAKRAFDVATAKMKNCVKELHYQACSYLTTHYDTILLPMFQTKQMLKPSRNANHALNDALVSLKHYSFRELLKAKCELFGKTLVVCSEMYTSLTCGRCNRLNLGLGSSEHFRCPHCSFASGRDVNAAFNILRFVSAGSLGVHALCH